MNYATWNGIEDQTKLQNLIDSMEADGWVGAPLVADNNQLLSGSHRYVAAQTAGIDVEVIDIRDIVENWDEILGEYIYDFDYDVAVVYAMNDLANDIKAEYGLDIH